MGNPLSTLPQTPSPRPTSPNDSQLPGQANLYLSRTLQPNLQLNSQIAVQRIELAGVQALPFEQVAAIFQPLSGKTVTVEQLALGVQQASKLYQDAGYPLSFVYMPEQDLSQGIVRIQAVEGHIHQVQIVGDTGKSARLLSEIARPIMDSKPLKEEVFTQQTLLMARMLNLKVGAQAAAPATTDGATPMVLHVKREPVVFSVGADLRQDAPRAVANLTFNDPLWGGSQWQLSALLDDPDEERYASATLHQWLNAKGTTLRASVSDFKGQDFFAGGLLQGITTQRRAELTVMHPLRIAKDGSSVIGFGWFGLNYGQRYNFLGLDLEIFGREKVRALQAHWIWDRNTTSTSQSLNASFTQGVDALGAGSERTEGLPANEARFDFFRLSLDYTYRQRLSNQWGFAIGLGGQAANDILPTSERISFGGMRYGRGYLAGEAAGDQGVGASIELNRHFASPNAQWVKYWEPYVMYEASKTWFHTALYEGQQLRSSSLGMRFGDNRYYALDLSLSKPQGFKSSFNPEQKLRWSLSLTYQLDI